MTCECKNKVTVNANGKKYVVCKDCYKIHYEDFYVEFKELISEEQ